MKGPSPGKHVLANARKVGEYVNEDDRNVRIYLSPAGLHVGSHSTAVRDPATIIPQLPKPVRRKVRRALDKAGRMDLVAQSLPGVYFRRSPAKHKEVRGGAHQ